MLTIREDEVVRQKVDAALADVRWPRAQDAWDAITWSIAHDPRIGESVTESGFTRSFVFEGAKSLGMPTVQVLYEIDGSVITIKDVRFSDAKYAQAGRA